jgi:hypothetical protein
MTHQRTLHTVLGLGVTLAVLLAAYLPLLQSIPNGSENYYMIDVGETQIVLNRWGTLHATGYPLFVMIGNALVALLRAFGISAATAPGAVSLVWGMLTATLIFALMCQLVRRAWLAAAITILFGLTRTMWIHNDIAEVYTMTLFFVALLLAIALWEPRIPGRLCWLALVGGIGVAHHRAVIFAAPALVFAVWPELIAMIRKRPAMLLGLLGLGLIGLLPYLYLYVRGASGAPWVYGEPGTLAGLIDQFMGKEADRFIGLPPSLLDNLTMINTVILTDLTLPGALAGLAGLVIGLYTHRRAALVLILSGGAAYLFHVLFYDDILSALILMATLSLAFGWLFLAEGALEIVREVAMQTSRLEALPIAPVLILMAAFGFAQAQYATNAPFIQSLVTDTTGLDTIAMAKQTPPGATLMLAWGPRYFAVGFAADVLGLLPGVHLVDHKADYKALLARGDLVTADYTFYNQPVSWWEDKIGAPVYLHAVAPHLVQINPTPEFESDPGAPDGVMETAHRIDCMRDKIVLNVAWHTQTAPTRDLSVFVHLLDANGTLIAQDDHSAPVYGWRPITTWLPQEVVRDVYTLPLLPSAASIRYGLYEQRADGSFNNVIVYTLPVECSG